MENKMINLIKADVLTLRKAKSDLSSVMVFHLAELQKVSKASGKDISDDEVIQYVKKAVQKLSENEFANPAEIAALTVYLPKMATEAQILEVISPILADGGHKGEVMKAVKIAFGASVDMKLVSQLC
jgi:uncharacterized protein YqeY